jgi:hypothetical protein
MALFVCINMEVEEEVEEEAEEEEVVVVVVVVEEEEEWGEDEEEVTDNLEEVEGFDIFRLLGIEKKAKMGPMILSASTVS